MALRSIGWTIAGFGVQQVLRLGSNLILTRLLFPEAFGIMALAQLFLVGLNNLSDIGVGPSIIQNKRGEDPDFLATAWTMQVMRGFAIFLGICPLAYPISQIYNEPILFPILILLGASSAVSGFQSIGLATANRKLALGRLTIIELCSQSVGIVVMVLWAWLNQSIWSLVGGGVIASTVRVILGHKLLASSGNHFHFERSAALDIFHFGKWIFAATALNFFGGQGLRLVEGYFVPRDILGMLHVAGTLGAIAVALTEKVGDSVLFPAFSAIFRERPEQLPLRLRESRVKLFWTTLPIFALLILFGRELITLMYDDRYMQAGTFLIIGATGSAVAAQRALYGMVLISVGDSFGHSILMTARAVARISAVIVGFHYGGVLGMLTADAITNLVLYPLEAWRLRLHGLWFPGFDLIVFSAYAAIGILSYFAGPLLF